MQLYLMIIRHSTDTLLGKPYYFSLMKQLYLY